MMTVWIVDPFSRSRKWFAHFRGTVGRQEDCKVVFWSAGVSPASGFSDASFAYFRHPTKISVTGGRDARAPSDFAILLKRATKTSLCYQQVNAKGVPIE